ncbi:hypothetical protein SAMN05444397_103292 [Flavobacterium aquidurense]|uniref:Holin-X, holin superfamily III n=1 Tax=Flavobacterium frigidimaris TaxID=262320 RepID=A0ABX4BU75_FLAFR|nr:hypothetical protein [Flavobacterium frigidimaris]OXA80804.1 hypothetical protein B0A65_05740 [Flavobacterium frigidimaris]SDZ06725.1 hypothetical protein SAMN05444397_103292 [Flavobacterium aquidurense]
MEDLEHQIKNEKIRQEWIEYRNSVLDNKSKSQDDFEKYINILASGGLVLSLTFFEKIVPLTQAIFKPFVIIGMFLMVITLLSNLYSHYKSIIDSDSTIKEIDEEKYNDIFRNIDKRNRKINRLNQVSIWALIFGIMCLIIFVAINIYHMNNDNQKVQERPNHPSPSIERQEKGRTTPPPPRNNPSPNPKK